MGADYDLEEMYRNTYTEEDRLAFENQPTSHKKFLLAWILTLIFGVVGAQRYYLGYYATAVTKTVMSAGALTLLTFEITTPGLGLFALVGTWTIIDLFLLLSGTMRDRFGHRLAGYQRFAGKCAVITVLALVIMLMAALIVGTSSAVNVQ